MSEIELPKTTLGKALLEIIEDSRKKMGDLPFTNPDGFTAEAHRAEAASFLYDIVEYSEPANDREATDNLLATTNKLKKWAENGGKKPLGFSSWEAARFDEALTANENRVPGYCGQNGELDVFNKRQPLTRPAEWERIGHIPKKWLPKTAIAAATGIVIAAGGVATSRARFEYPKAPPLPDATATVKTMDAQSKQLENTIDAPGAWDPNNRRKTLTDAKTAAQQLLDTVATQQGEIDAHDWAVRTEEHGRPRMDRTEDVIRSVTVLGGVAAVFATVGTLLLSSLRNNKQQKKDIKDALEKAVDSTALVMQEPKIADELTRQQVATR